MKRFKTNIMIFGLAIVLAVSLFYITENTALFSASILSLQDAETIKAKSRDIGYKNEGNILDTFLSEKLDSINSITFSVIYDYENIDLDLEKLSAQTDYQIVSTSNGALVIKFTNFSGVSYDYQQSLFELPFTGNNGNTSTVLISEGIVKLSNGDNKNLSIGSLNIDSEYHHN